jgi:hypothetical protein
MPVAQACNPSYSGGRDQDDHGSKPAQTTSSQDPILKEKKKSQKKVGGLSQGEFRPQYHQKKS